MKRNRILKPSERLLRKALDLLHRWTLKPAHWTPEQFKLIDAGRDPLRGLYRYFFGNDGLPKTLTCAELLRAHNLSDLNEFLIAELAEAEKNIRAVRRDRLKAKTTKAA